MRPSIRRPARCCPFARAALLAPLLAALACVPGGRVHARAAEEVRRGYASLEAGDVERAEVAFAHALEFNPDLAEALNGAGVAAERRGDRDEARRRFARAVTSRPDFAEGHVNLGVLALSCGETGEAVGHLRRALSIDPDLAVARLDLARALLHAGRADREARDDLWAQARVEYLHLLETLPAAPAAWHDLGFMDLESGRFARAEAEYGRAVQAEPESVPALHGLCVARVRLGLCREALAPCARCQEIAPGSAECRRSLMGARACAEK